MKRISLLVFLCAILLSCAGSGHQAKHKKLDPKKRIPCPTKDC